MNTFSLEEIKELFQLNHPEKFLAFFPGMNAKVAADIFGVDLEFYTQSVNEFKKNAEKAADELLEDKGFTELVQKVPFKKGDVIIGFGDSITDDYHSWFEILTNIFNKEFGKNYFKMINAGISGDTSLNLIKRLPGIINEKPDWIICMVGTNDSIRSRLLPSRTNISFDETKSNLDYLVEIAKNKTEAKWVWITPPNINIEKINAHPFTEILQNAWEKKDLINIAEYMKQRPEPVADLWKSFGDPVNDEYLNYDGLHPSIKGHKVIVKELLEQIK